MTYASRPQSVFFDLAKALQSLCLLSLASRHLLQELHVALDLSVKLCLLRLQLGEKLRILRIKRLDALL